MINRRLFLKGILASGATLILPSIAYSIQKLYTHSVIIKGRYIRENRWGIFNRALKILEIQNGKSGHTNK